MGLNDHKTYYAQCTCCRITIPRLDSIMSHSKLAPNRYAIRACVRASVQRHDAWWTYSLLSSS